jgi:hypothetical protein
VKCLCIALELELSTIIVELRENSMELNLNTLENLKIDIGYSLIDDCCNFIGLHKFIDFNLIDENFKQLMLSLFTRYNNPAILESYLSWLSQLQEGVTDDSFTYLIKNMPELANQFVDYFMFKIEHYKKINDFIKNKINAIEYKHFLDISLYDLTKSYPFTEIEVLDV